MQAIRAKKKKQKKNDDYGVIFSLPIAPVYFFFLSFFSFFFSSHIHPHNASSGLSLALSCNIREKRCKNQSNVCGCAPGFFWSCYDFAVAGGYAIHIDISIGIDIGTRKLRMYKALFAKRERKREPVVPVPLLLSQL